MTFSKPPGTSPRIPAPNKINVAQRPPASAPAPVLGRGTAPGAVYWLDANIGIGFAAASQLAALVAHLGGRLRVVDDVVAEWNRKAADADRPRPPYPPEAAAAYDRWFLVRKMCRYLDSTGGRAVLAPYEVTLGAEESDKIRGLRDVIARMPPPQALEPWDYWSHLGEAACVRAATLYSDAERAAGRPIPAQVLCTNDQKAARLAAAHGMAVRTTAELAREMVDAGTYSSAEAWAHHVKMDKATSIWSERKPENQQFFA